MASLPDTDPGEVRAGALLFCIERTLYMASLASSAASIAERLAQRAAAEPATGAAPLAFAAAACARLRSQLRALAAASGEVVGATIVAADTAEATSALADAVERIADVADVADALHGSAAPAAPSSPARGWIDAAGHVLELAAVRGRKAGAADGMLPIERIEAAFALASAQGEDVRVRAGFTFLRAALLAGWGPARRHDPDDLPMLGGDAFAEFLERARDISERGTLDAERTAAAALRSLGHDAAAWTAPRRKRKSRDYARRRRGR